MKSRIYKNTDLFDTGDLQIILGWLWGRKLFHINTFEESCMPLSKKVMHESFPFVC